MKKNSFALLPAAIMAFYSSQSTAVHQAPNGLGEVLIYPYYTVNNELNTLYSVVNTTAEPKALVVRFLEGDISHEALVFHVYLDAYDVWTGALVPTTSTVVNHTGEESVLHLSAETSCAPYLNKSGQEFLPFVIDLDSDPANHNMRRVTEGHIEIMEFGVLTGQAANALSMGSVGVPANCGFFEQEWSDDSWDAEPLDPPTGGLKGTATLMNVNEGIAFTYDAVALENFWQGAVEFTAPGSLEPNLSHAGPEATVMLRSGEIMQTSWEHGYQAVSEVLTNSSIINEYVLDTIVNGKTDWVLTFPTKRFHVNHEDVVTAPFDSGWDGSQACSTFDLEVWDRESQMEISWFKSINSSTPVVSPRLTPRPPNGGLPESCFAANVFEFLLPGQAVPAETSVLGSDNALWINSPATGVTENGWAQIVFPDGLVTNPESGVSLLGMPVTGFSAFQYTNAGAAQGLLAQYGGIMKHSGRQLLSQ